MKSIYFNDEINAFSVKTLLENIDKIDKDENIILYFCSTGGDVPDSYILIDYINRQAKRFELVCFWTMGSAAFHLLWKVNCKVTIGKDVTGQLHLFTNSLESRELVNKFSESNYLKDNVTKNDKEWIEDLKHCKLTKEEYNYILNGGMLYINSDRVKSIVSILRNRHDLVYCTNKE